MHRERVAANVVRISDAPIDMEVANSLSTRRKVENAAFVFVRSFAFVFEMTLQVTDFSVFIPIPMIASAPNGDRVWR